MGINKWTVDGTRINKLAAKHNFLGFDLFLNIAKEFEVFTV